MSSDIFGRKCLNRKVQNANHARGSTKIQGHKYKTLWTQKLTCKTCRFLFRRKNKILSEIEHHQSQYFLFSSSFQWIWSTQPLFPFLIKRIDGIKPTLKVAFPVLLFQWIWSGSGSDGIKPRLKFQFSFPTDLICGSSFPLSYNGKKRSGCPSTLAPTSWNYQVSEKGKKYSFLMHHSNDMIWLA